MSKSKVIEDLITEWNIRFPIDRIWRKKYNIPFGSSQHFSMNLIDIKIDIAEDVLFDKLIKERMEREEDEEYGISRPNQKEIKMKQKDIENEYDNLDLDKFNEIPTK